MYFKISNCKTRIWTDREGAIKTNEESTKCLLQQKKFKKFNIMKHKPQASHKEVNVKENEKGRPIRTYANALAQGPRRRSLSQENKQKTGRDQLQMLLVEMQAQTIYQMKNQYQLKKIQFWTSTRKNKLALNHQQEATPKVTILKTNKQKTSKRNWRTQEKNSAIKTKPKRWSQKQRDQDKQSQWPLKKPARALQQRGLKSIQHQSRSNRSNEFHSTKIVNFTKLRRTIKTSLKQRHDQDGRVINLSKHSFSKDTFKLINNNLSFLSTPGIQSKSKLNDELQNFHRLIKLKAYFKDTESTTRKDENTMFIPEKEKPWTHSQDHHWLETFIDLVQRDINDAKILNTKRTKDNLTRGEQKALDEISKRDDIIIINAAKGGAIVITDIDKYITEAQCQLNDDNYYKNSTQIRLYNTTN